MFLETNEGLFDFLRHPIASKSSEKASSRLDPLFQEIVLGYCLLGCLMAYSRAMLNSSDDSSSPVNLEELSDFVLLTLNTYLRHSYPLNHVPAKNLWIYDEGPAWTSNTTPSPVIVSCWCVTFKSTLVVPLQFFICVRLKYWDENGCQHLIGCI